MPPVETHASTASALNTPRGTRRQRGIPVLLPALPFVLLAFGALAYSVFKPNYNWDMLGYMAVSLSWDEPDIAKVHAATYETARASVPEAAFEELVSGACCREYREALHADPETFAEHLPWYQIRPVYVGLIHVLGKLGLGLAFATHFVSGVATALAILLLYRLSASMLTGPLFYAVPFLILFFKVMDLGRFSSPDALAFLGAVAAAHAFYRRRFVLLLALLPVLVGIRTDWLLLSLPLALSVIVLDKKWVVAASASVLASLAVYFVLARSFDHPGWMVTNYFALVEFVTHPLSNPPPALTPGQYLGFIARGGAELFLYSGSFQVYALGVGAIVFLAARAVRTSGGAALRNPPVVLAVVCAAFMAAHFLAFPVTWERLYTAPYILGTFSLLVLLQSRSGLVENKGTVEGGR